VGLLVVRNQSSMTNDKGRFLFTFIFSIYNQNLEFFTQHSSDVTRSMVIPGPETEVIGESGSGGLGAQPSDAEKGLILHVLRISENCSISKSTLMNDHTCMDKNFPLRS